MHCNGTIGEHCRTPAVPAVEHQAVHASRKARLANPAKTDRQEPDFRSHQVNSQREPDSGWAPPSQLPANPRGSLSRSFWEGSAPGDGGRMGSAHEHVEDRLRLAFRGEPGGGCILLQGRRYEKEVQEMHQQQKGARQCQRGGALAPENTGRFRCFGWALSESFCTVREKIAPSSAPRGGGKDLHRHAMFA